MIKAPEAARPDFLAPPNPSTVGRRGYLSSPPHQTLLQSFKSPRKWLRPLTYGGCPPPLSSVSVGPGMLTCPGKKYLLLAPRSNGVRLVKPRRFVRWDLVMGPRAPGAGGCRVLDPS